MKNRIALLAALVLLLFIVITSCSNFLHPKPLHFSGTLELTEHSVGTPVSGRLETLLVDEGDSVETGQLLATLERYEQAKKDNDRITELFKEGGATQQEVEEAGLALQDQCVVSPVDGVVLLKVHEPGEVIPAGGAILVIGDRSSLWVRIFVPEGMISRVSMNDPATLRFDGLKKSYKGRVSYIATKGEFTPRNVQTPEERVTQTFAVKIAVDEPQEFLRPGVACEVTLHLKRR